MKFLLTALTALFCVACDEPVRRPVDAAADVQGDVQNDTTGSDLGSDTQDAAADMTQEDAGPVFRTDSFSVGDAEVRFHPAAAFDGESIWLTYTSLEPGTRFFDVHLLSVAFDGTWSAPVTVNTAIGESELDSSVAVSGDRIMVVYQSDDRSGAPTAIRPFVRVFDSTGAPVTEPRQVANERAAGSVATNWMPSLAPRPGGFWLAGSWGVESVSQFQVYAQSLELDGTPTALAADFAPDGDVAQGSPVIRGGALPRLAWTNLGDAGSTVVSREGPDVQPLDVGTIQADMPTLTDSLIAFHAGGGGRFNIHVRDFDGGGEASIGRLSEADLAPSIAGRSESFALVWIRRDGSSSGELHVAHGSSSGDAVTISMEQPIATHAPAIVLYRPDIVFIRDDIYFITWVEREGEGFDVRGRFVQFAGD